MFIWNYFEFQLGIRPEFQLSLCKFEVQMKELIPIEEGDYYLSEKGYKVFTAQFHLKRGYCCESGCRHCPYGFDKRTNMQKRM